MRVKRSYIVLSFDVPVDAMAWEKHCAEAGIPGRLIPLPRELSAGCGLAWRMLPEEWDLWEKRLQNDPKARYHAVATVQQ